MLHHAVSTAPLTIGGGPGENRCLTSSPVLLFTGIKRSFPPDCNILDNKGPRRIGRPIIPEGLPGLVTAIKSFQEDIHLACPAFCYDMVLVVMTGAEL